MFRTFFFFLILWFALFISLPLLIPYYIMDFFRWDRARKSYIRVLTSAWAEFTLLTAGIRYTVLGVSKIPVVNNKFLIISNHESNFDIPLLMAVLPFSPAFIAKKELMNFPFIRSWMKAMECLPIDRNNPRNLREMINQRISAEDSNPLLLFPEGTRSRRKEMGVFRTGTLKIIFNKRMEILPVTINGSYRGFEERKRIRPARVKISFHDTVRTSDYEPEQFHVFLDDLTNIISGPLKER